MIHEITLVISFLGLFLLLLRNSKSYLELFGSIFLLLLLVISVFIYGFYYGRDNPVEEKEIIENITMNEPTNHSVLGEVIVCDEFSTVCIN
jgi:hypothetical protein